MKYLVTTAAALGLMVATAAPLHAQNVSANNLVNVQLSDSLIENIANDLSVDVSQIPVTVQAPIGIAANVCNVAANVLATDTSAEGASCDAETTSQAFNNLVQKRISG